MKRKKGSIRNRLLILVAFLITGTIFAFLSSQSKGLFRISKYGNIMTAEASEPETGDIKVSGSRKSMSIEYGYDQYVKYGRYISVSATIDSEEDDSFQGWFEVISPKEGQNTVYRREVKLAKQSETKATIYMPVIDDSGYIQVKLLNKDESTILEKKIKVKLGNYEKLVYVGVLSDNPTDLKYLESLGNRVFYLNKDTLPQNYLGLDLLDVLVINEFDTGKLADEQIEAILKWTKQGGSLVFGTGVHGSKTLKAFKTELHLKGSEKVAESAVNLCDRLGGIKELKQVILDLEESRRMFLDNVKSRNDMLAFYGDESIEIDYSIFDKWTKNKVNNLREEIVDKHIYDIAFANDYETVLSQENLNLLIKHPYEYGNIQLFTFDLGLKNTEVTTGLTVITAIRNNLSYTKQNQLENEYYGSDNNYGIYSNVSRGYTDKVPMAGGYIIVLVIYIILVGPIAYLVLKKLDKRSLAWGIIPALAVVFTVFIFIMGSKTRIDEPYAGYVKLLNFNKGNTAEENLYFSLTAPFNTAYSIILDKKYKVTEMSGNSPAIYNYGRKVEVDFANTVSTIQYGFEHTELKIQNNPAFTPVYYQSENTFNVPNKLSTEISYTGEELKGTIDNGFDFDISNAFLVSDGYIVALGELKKGEKVVLADKQHLFLNAKDDLYSEEILRKLSGKQETQKNLTAKENNIAGILTYLIENNQIWEANQSYLFGFANDKGDQISEGDTTVKAYKEQDFTLLTDNILTEIQSQITTYGMTVLKFAIDVNYANGDKSFVSSLDPYIVMEEGHYDKYNQARYLTSNDMNIEYHLPENEKVTSFEFLQNRNQENRNDYLKNFEGVVYFKNIKTNNFDEVYRSGTSSSVTDVDKYLTKDNTITVRYSTDMSLKGYQIVLPHISYWKEGTANADNKESN
ncbi:hypothetical protein acsn021_09270 [Anaerocolumna cellulosilytica]|uniref:Uncharacterized protein n=1 Tax=Anaerocolumna cellulosilytica TaxID=433286 RepID=A0A6S6R2U9_9FIRM|nr:hypothetical protein [Anaerocolumna cellulosilytica]MBB5194414.1 hypothetical protein [Anaerocolumna cellulosilytica]BCJ93358.1 hypothetical protein acsn021_09270 [Anaerocolumna cellulosilytica]